MPTPKSRGERSPAQRREGAPPRRARKRARTQQEEREDVAQVSTTAPPLVHGARVQKEFVKGVVDAGTEGWYSGIAYEREDSWRVEYHDGDRETFEKTSATEMSEVRGLAGTYGLPIAPQSLPSRPCIIANVGTSHLEGMFSTPELLGGAPPGRWTGASVSELDLTTEEKYGRLQKERQDLAVEVGERLCVADDEMSAVVLAIAELFGVNVTSCVGANRVGNRTPDHQHVMGVLSRADDSRGPGGPMDPFAPP